MVCHFLLKPEFAGPVYDAGVKAAGQAAFVLVAGGLGERLGYSGIKLALPVDSASGKCFLQVGPPNSAVQHLY